MSKAFTKETDSDDNDEHDAAAEEAAHAPLAGRKNYITPSGLQRLRDELRWLLLRRSECMLVQMLFGSLQRSSGRR